MRARLALALLSVMSMATAARTRAQAMPDSTLRRIACTPPVSDGAVVEVSMVQLIATPERFHGCRVRVVGFLWLEFEGNGVYLHREDFERSMYRNGLWVSFRPGTLSTRSRVSGHYVLLEGRFDAEQRGHFGMWSGTLDDITRADTVLSRAQSRRALRHVKVLAPPRDGAGSPR